MRSTKTVFASVLGLALATSVGTAPAQATESRSCSDVRLPVSLSPGLPRTEVIDGTLCVPAAGSTEVDVLIHGAAYNRSYWDWPVAPNTYSYVQRTVAAGRATFAYDRLGAGSSSHPLSALLTPQSDAYVLHQVVEALRRHRFTTVDAVGHSFGSVVAVQEAATFHDTDRLVVTGLL